MDRGIKAIVDSMYLLTCCVVCSCEMSIALRRAGKIPKKPKKKDIKRMKFQFYINKGAVSK